MKALEKERTRRYETANGLAQDVQRYLAGEPVQAAPPSATYRLRKLAQKHRGVVLAASVVLLTLVVGIAGTTWGLVVARQAAATEQEARQAADAETVKAVAAAEAERQAKKAAQQRLAQIEKGVELFAGLVRGLNPRNEEQGGPPLYEQLRQRAVKAADALVGEAVGDAEAVARLQTLLGLTLRELGDAAKAVEVLERARTTQQARLGADHSDTLATLHNLAGAYRDVGKLPEAIALFEHVRDANVKKLGADHPDTLSTLANLAGAYLAADKLPEAIALFEQVRDAIVKNLGADHPQTLAMLNNLALAYRDADKLPEAIALFAQVRDALVKKQGADHPDTLSTLHNLALTYQDAGKLPEAIALFEQVRDARLKKLGADHPYTLLTLHNLAVAYQAAGMLPQAIALFEQVRDASVKKLGADHPQTLAMLNNLAVAYRAVGKLPEAIALYKQVRDANVKKLGADHPDTLTTLNNLAVAYQAAGKLDQALPLFAQAAAGIEKRRFQHQHAGAIIAYTIAAYEQAEQFDQAEAWRRKWLAVVKQQAGADSPAYTGELAALGLNLLQQRKWTDAEATLNECLAIRRKTQPDLWSTFNTMSMLGRAMLGQKQYAAAEPLLVQGFLGMKQRADKIPLQGKPRLGEAADRLIALYEARGQPDEATKWRKERQTLEPTAPNQGAAKKR
jgi:tetratricopeptide (TPR) repeat protein